MAQLIGKELQNHKAGFQAFYKHGGKEYCTIWSKVLGPVRKRMRPSNIIPSPILIDMWPVTRNEHGELNKSVCEFVDVGEDPWCAAVEAGPVVETIIPMDELTVFIYPDDYAPKVERLRPSKIYISEATAEEEFYEYLQAICTDVEPVLYDRRLCDPEFHASLLRCFKDYEFFRENNLRESIFFYYWSRDCDQCEVEGAQIFNSWGTAAQWIVDFYSRAEGPANVSPMTYEQWARFSPAPLRDRIAEKENY